MNFAEVFHIADDPGRFVMTNPPLQRVLVDLQYPLAPRLVMPQGLVDLQDKLRGIFPVVRPIGAPTFTISFGSPQAPIDQSLASRYQFSNSDGLDVQIGAGNTTLSIPGSAYREGVSVASLLMAIAEAIGSVGRMSQCDRIGVRYINAAPASPADWAHWFKPEFTGWTETGIVDERATRVAMLITQLALPQGDIVTAATIRHGYLPNGLGGDLTASAAATEPSFLLDIDMATDKPMPLDPAQIHDAFRAILRDVARYLRYTFTPAGEEQFGVQNAPQREEEQG
jgi:uncharacterized protein (TIGR04255 family)